MKTLSISLILFSVFAFAQTKEPKVNINNDLLVKALKAQHRIDEVEQNKKDVQIQLQNVLQEWNAKEAQAKKDLDEAYKEIFRQAGRDQTKEDYNLDTGEFTPKNQAKTPPKTDEPKQ